MFQHPIAISLSPNTEEDDLILALKTLFKPGQWKKGRKVQEVKKWFEKYYPDRDVFLLNSGRSAMFAILSALRIGKGDEVLLQAFTCTAAVEPIIWVGAKPIYADIESRTFNIDPSDILKKISSRTKAIVVQHTFGIPANMEAIVSIAQKHKLWLIEDCAHSLGASYKGKKIGSFGAAAFFSFGRDKVISSVFGGAAIINKQLKLNIERLDKECADYHYPVFFWILQQILHPIFFAAILPLYHFFNIGKVMIVLFQRLKLLSKPIYKEEYLAQKPAIFPQKLPNAMAILAIHQLKKLERFNKRRLEIARKYGKVIDGAIYLRYPILAKNPQTIFAAAERKKILLGKWYANIIDPIGVSLKKLYYKKGSCPKAEHVAKKIVNLPTYPKMSKNDILEVKNLIREIL